MLTSRVVELQRTADGQDLIVYSREFYEQAGIFLAIFHAGYHSSRELELRANRISEYPNQQPSTGPPATASRLVRVETSSSRAYEQTCASCKISGNQTRNRTLVRTGVGLSICGRISIPINPVFQSLKGLYEHSCTCLCRSA